MGERRKNPLKCQVATAKKIEELFTELPVLFEEYMRCGLEAQKGMVGASRAHRDLKARVTYLVGHWPRSYRPELVRNSACKESLVSITERMQSKLVERKVPQRQSPAELAARLKAPGLTVEERLKAIEKAYAEQDRV